MLGTSVLDNMHRDVYVATAADSGELGGQIITWVTHASLVPEKRNVICIFSKFNHTYKLLNSSGKFVINLPTEDQLKDVAIFGLASGNDENKFSHFKNYTLKDSIPVLNNSCGYLILKVLKQVDLGDRVIVIGRVTEEFFEKEKAPLKLRHFLNGLDDKSIEVQKKKYMEMVVRDSKLIKDQF